jgi:dTMP kinase
MFIVIDGIDGCGKSTQVKLLADSLLQEGTPVSVTKWQDSSYIQQLYIGDLLKRIQAGNVKIPPPARTFLLGADISYRLETIIKPLLMKGDTVIGDRYVYKVIAQGIVRGLEKNWLTDLFKFAPEPELKIMLDVLPEVALRRISSTREVSFYEAGLDVLPGLDRESAYLKFQSQVRIELLKLMEETDGVVISGELPHDEQNREIMKRIKERSAPIAT